MQWVCEICGYIHDEQELPESCPVCGAPQDKFSEWSEENAEAYDDDDEDEDFEKDLFGDYEDDDNGGGKGRRK